MTPSSEEKDDWMGRARTESRALFSELDVLLRAVDRFFAVENLGLSGEALASKNFNEELIAVRETILRILGVLEAIIPENRRNAYWFQKYAEAKYLSPGSVEAFREELYRQDAPEKAILLLYDSFINLKGIITDLLRAGNISYLGFKNVGHLVGKAIRENAYFNPFTRSLNPEFDVITNDTVSRTARSIANREEKKQVSVIYLYLFRFLRMMSFVEVSSQRSASLSASLLILMLLRSEIAVFLGYVDKAVKKIPDPALRMLLQSVAYQFRMETKRVYEQELKDIIRKKAAAQVRGKIENSHGILKNLTEHSIVFLTQHYAPSARGEEIFMSFTTRVEQSLRLREDIVALHSFLVMLEGVAGRPSARARVFESLRNYLGYFESFTFRLLRHDDYEEFSHFFTELTSVRKETVATPKFDKTLEKVRHFKIFLETTLRHIGNRAELSGRPVDRQRVDSLVSQYL
ncbi:MAG: hypothetical protein OHK006_05510 [Thermodesulfovibrionales bacterium]